MRRYPNHGIESNTQLSGARRRTVSPSRSVLDVSRSELADAINTRLGDHATGPNQAAIAVDARWLGKLGRGEVRWPSEERRTALRHLLGTTTDEDLGLHRPTHRDQ